MNFQQAREMVESHSAGCHDLRAKGKNMMVADGGFQVYASDGECYMLGPTDYAKQQLLSRLDIEKRAFDKMTIFPKYHARGGQFDTALRAVVVNTRLVEHNPSMDWLVRCREETARAFLSGRYRPFDHRPFLDALLDPRTNIEQVAQIHSFRLGNLAEDLYLKVTMPDLTVERHGETYETGLLYWNGELGNRSLGCAPFIFRQACTNDLILQSEFKFQQRHVGTLRPNIVTAIFADLTLQMLEEAVAGVEKLESLREVEIPDLAKEVKRLKERLKLTEPERIAFEALADMEASGTSTNAFHVVNGLTALARIQKSPDRAIELEMSAGGLLEQYIQKLHQGEVVRQHVYVTR